jgi:succinate dehydrogenase/fumarate reductase flavoprotein subunit
VMDMQGQVIPGLYCGGESAGGFNQHGLGRCTAQGYIAGKHAAAENPEA